TWLFGSWPSARNATHSESGEKRGESAPSVPASGVASNWSSRRRKRRVGLRATVRSTPTYTISLPSGDTSNAPVTIDAVGGACTMKRVIGRIALGATAGETNTRAVARTSATNTIVAMAHVIRAADARRRSVSGKVDTGV